MIEDDETTNEDCTCYNGIVEICRPSWWGSEVEEAYCENCEEGRRLEAKAEPLWL